MVGYIPIFVADVNHIESITRHGKRLHNYGKSRFFKGKSTINHYFQWVNPLKITIFEW